MNKKRVGSVFVVIGAVLMLSALLLLLYNTVDARRAGNASSQALAVLQEAIDQYEEPDIDAETVVPSETEAVSEEILTELTEPAELQCFEVEGYDYIGYLSIPGLELELPVMSQISEERLYKAPCLQFGTPMTNDAVIAGHNYKYHFLPLHDIQIGEQVHFTYLNGFVVRYAVSRWEIVAPTDISAVQNSEHDLVMYTCTSGGTNRVAVFCDRVEEITS